jgi:subtilisin family serine protease
VSVYGITSKDIHREAQEPSEQMGATVEQANAYYLDESYESYFVEYIGDVATSVRRTGVGDVFFFNKFFTLLFVKKGSIGQLLQSAPEIINIEKNFIYTLLPLRTEEELPDLSVINVENTTLNGERVIVGIVGTGIDYLNPRFITERGETRIVSIWDQSLNQGPKPETFIYGTEFTRENINNAIRAKSIGEEPYQIVNHKDEIGHGTAVAGIIGGRSLDESELFKSVAPSCEFAIIKLKTAKRSNLELVGLEDHVGNVYDSNDVTASMRYLSQLQQKLKAPMVVYLTIGTNLGGHDGGTVAERYLDFFTNRRDFTMVTSTGGEGNTATHSSGNLLETGGSNIVEVKVSTEQKNLLLSVYTVTPDRVSLGIISPNGQSLDKIDVPFVNGGEISVALGESNIYIQYFLEEAGIGDQRIDILFRNMDEGIWKINIIGDTVVNGQYNCWLQQRELLKGDTRFLKPNSAITLMTPATAKNIIVASSYNEIEGTILGESGRGFTRDGRIKPQVAVGSKNIITIGLNNSNTVSSGPAISGALLTGAVALLFQWGVVRNNDIDLFPQKIASYIIEGSDKREAVIYPNEREGFGVFNFEKFLRNLENKSRVSEVSRCDSYFLNSEFNTSREVAPVDSINYSEEIFQNYYLNEEYDNYIVDYTGNIFETFENIDYGVVYFSDNFSAIVSIKRGMVERLLEDVPEITNIQKSSVYNLSNLQISNEPYVPLAFDKMGLSLEGQDVIVGVIGTGIDYLNERFMTQDERSRVLTIWDQTLEQGPPAINTFGTEFTTEKINEAIRLSKEGGDPYSVVSHKDDNGYGTSIAGIIGARNLGGNDDLISLAPRCNFAIVKLKEAKNNTLELNGIEERKGDIYETTDIALALKYLSTIQIKENKPMVVYVPLGSNCGGHDGSDGLERYIDFLLNQRGFVVVNTSGNQGNTNTHTSGVLSSSGAVETIVIMIDEEEKNFCMAIYLELGDRVSLGIIAPNGETIERIQAPLAQEDIVEVSIQDTLIEIRYLIQEPTGGSQAIMLSMKGVKSGIWQIQLLGDSILGGRYDAWMLQSELLSVDTKFLKSDETITLMLPSTAQNILTGTYFNEVANKLPVESGRGYTRDRRIKPGVAVGGTNILTVGLNGRYIVASGDAMAGGILAGITALLLQWGIVQENDIQMFPSRIRIYLIAACTKQEGVQYPNREVGYGVLSINELFRILSELSKNPSSRNINDHSIVKFSKELYINIPKELYCRILNKTFI